ncbi:hypothetical protein HYFRA_00004390 [Hymenoscyphus fraxineus]|uniref:Long-chain-alcohol oxidase n=1 Tax=Hymenoscyphus fraxineus TaxID=746836 RepID=A0A9N9KXM9_9HELO|nr:hypothetical protein HYFRA_00004390 [Hymenoscyphus fraxineus]
MESQIAPIPTPHMSGPVLTPFTDSQWTTLLSILDTVIPSIQPSSLAKSSTLSLALPEEQYNATISELQKTVPGEITSERFDEYMNEKASDVEAFQDMIKRAFGTLIPEKNRRGVAFILSTLDTRLGCMLLTGYTTSFHEQPVHVREAILDSWRTSYLPTLNVIHKSMTMLAKNVYLKSSPLYRSLSGVPVVPVNYKPGTGYEYDFLQFDIGPDPEIIETDIVIVGSGCGGAVCAKNLSEAGHRVLVLEKGYYFSPKQLPLSEETGNSYIFESGGAISTDDGSVAVAAGSIWGGGGTVNWSASLQPQDFVRREWAQERGLEFFETMEFQGCLDRVCERMGVSTDHIRHNHGNRVLLEGSRKLGYTAKAVPQNTGGKEHYCGYCTFGCGSNEKKGPVASFLPDAAQAGAKFVEGFNVGHVIFDEENPNKAIGVRGSWTSRDNRGGVDGLLSERTTREVIVKAKKVVLSCGSLWSPIILQNSGLTNPQIGRNLYLHPVNFLAAIYEEETRPWEGGILTSVCNTFENLSSTGYGAKLETTVMLPSIFLSTLTSASALEFKINALKLRHMAGFISLARDRDTGIVYKNPETGKPAIKYTPSVFDRAHILEGLIGAAKIAYVTGALEIHPCLQGLPPFIRSSNSSSESKTSPGSDIDLGITDPHFVAWLEEVRRVGNKPLTGLFSSAHQMGSCRMSRSESEGVVDGVGRVWGRQDLYVADASVFPSASGVNPMVTNMAIADWISRGIVGELRREG